ncbi:hypothetical protein [Nisaea sp.]
MRAAPLDDLKSKFGNARKLSDGMLVKCCQMLTSSISIEAPTRSRRLGT